MKIIGTTCNSFPVFITIIRHLWCEVSLFTATAFHSSDCRMVIMDHPPTCSETQYVTFAISMICAACIPIIVIWIMGLNGFIINHTHTDPGNLDRVIRADHLVDRWANLLVQSNNYRRDADISRHSRVYLLMRIPAISSICPISPTFSSLNTLACLVRADSIVTALISYFWTYTVLSLVISFSTTRQSCIVLWVLTHRFVLWTYLVSIYLMSQIDGAFFTRGQY